MAIGSNEAEEGPYRVVGAPDDQRFVGGFTNRNELEIYDRDGQRISTFEGPGVNPYETITALTWVPKDPGVALASGYRAAWGVVREWAFVGIELHKYRALFDMQYGKVDESLHPQ